MEIKELMLEKGLKVKLKSISKIQEIMKDLTFLTTVEWTPGERCSVYKNKCSDRVAISGNIYSAAGKEVFVEQASQDIVLDSRESIESYGFSFLSIKFSIGGTTMRAPAMMFDFESLLEDCEIEKTQKQEDFDLESIMEEMISKVDIQKLLVLYEEILIQYKDLEPDKFQIDSMLHNWAKNKAEIYMMLGRNLTVSKRADIEADPQEISNSARGIYYNVIEESSKKEFLRTMMVYFTPEEIRSNRIIQDRDMSILVDSVDEELKQKAVKCYNKGMKLSKFMSKVLESEPINIELSKVIQNANSEGFLEISIDPIEFFMMSENASRWRSCQTVFSQNCYSTACISYIQDPTTLIAYVHSGKKFQYGSLNHHSKNWRQLYFYDKKHYAIAGSRHYPSTREVFAKKTREILEKRISSMMKVENKWKVCRDKSCISDLVSNYGNFHYNDISHYSGDMSCEMAYNLFLTSKDEIEFHVGSEDVRCLSCGKELQDSGPMICEFCEETYKQCPNCGDFFSDEDHEYRYCEECRGWCEECGEEIAGESINVIGSSVFCSSCAEDHFECCECGDAERISERVFDVNDNEYCDYCAGRCLSECEHCEENFRTYDLVSINGVDVCEDCYNDNYVECDHCGCDIEKDRSEQDEYGNRYCTDCYEDLSEEEQEYAY